MISAALQEAEGVENPVGKAIVEKSNMMPSVTEVLVSSEEIKEKVREIGERITEDYRGERLLLVGILRGAVVFLSDLMRHLQLPCEIDFMEVSSYGTDTTPAGWCASSRTSRRT